jgi:dTDP-4-amino-4,6-dideoxygalactose transaminase
MGEKTEARSGSRGAAAIAIPAVDPKTEYEALRGEIDAAVGRVLASGWYVGGPEVEGLEKEFAAFCGVPHAVAVGNGTDALRFALVAAGVRPGDEVVTSPLTFIATTEAIAQAGGKAVFADVDPRSRTLDPARVEQALTPRTRAILPVHLYGQTADMAPILDLAKRHGLLVVEDACQAHGARYGERAAGSLGAAAGFSFYPTKNLSACGEGGIVTTGSAEIASRVRRLRDHGQAEKYRHVEEGWNGRLDALQCAILRIKLRRLEAWNGRRRALAARYRERLRALAAPPEAAARPASPGALILPEEMAWGRHVYHLFAIRVADRVALREALRRQGIDTGMHYPIPLHLQPAYASLGLGEGSFPHAEAAAGEVLTLPLYPTMPEESVDLVSDALGRALAAR